MCSRNGKRFHQSDEAFLLPSTSRGNWKYGDNYMPRHVIETKSDVPDRPRELSIFASEGYWIDDAVYLV